MMSGSEENQSSDNIYDTPRSVVSPFEFNSEVVNVFEDMIRRSVPGYGLTLQLMSSVASELSNESPLIYDLGCSLGAGMIALDRGLNGKAARIIGVDTSEPMIDKAAGLLKSAGLDAQWELLKGDVNEVPLEEHDLSVMNFTLQFISLEERLPLLQRIHQKLKPGGMLVLSEKLKFDDDQEQAVQTTLHHNFKRLNGYTDLEISQKRQALENTLIPETFGEHEARLKAAGFSQVYLWLKAFNFVSILAIK